MIWIVIYIAQALFLGWLFSHDKDVSLPWLLGFIPVAAHVSMAAFYPGIIYGFKEKKAHKQRIRINDERILEAEYQDTLRLIEWKPKQLSALEQLEEEINLTREMA